MVSLKEDPHRSSRETGTDRQGRASGREREGDSYLRRHASKPAVTQTHAHSYSHLRPCPRQRRRSLFLWPKLDFPFECGLECEHFWGKKIYILHTNGLLKPSVITCTFYHSTYVRRYIHTYTMYADTHTHAHTQLLHMYMQKVSHLYGSTIYSRRFAYSN